MLGAFLFAFVSVFAVAIGGRDQLLIARLAGQPGAAGSAMAVGALSATLSAFAMAVTGLALALVLPAAAADMLVAFALALAAIELAWHRAPRLPQEPTRSLFAALVVLLARQWGDAARFLVFAFAAGGNAWLAGAGGALGGIAALAIGAAVGERDLLRWPLRQIRLGLAAILLVAAIGMGLAARGIIG